MSDRFSWARVTAVLVKEFVQMRRDRLTFGMIVGIPVMQLILFGFAINPDPKGLPTAVLDANPSVYSRSLLSAMQTSGYFRIVHHATSEPEIARLLDRGQVQFAVTVPTDFSRRIERGERPTLLVEADATDPAATSNALATLGQISQTALNLDLRGALADRRATPAPFDLRIHRLYNPDAISQYNIVPGLMGVVLTMTMVMMTALAVTRERERGTMENLLATPVRPAEVMIGKIAPYIMVGYMQVALILVFAEFLFGVPIAGSIVLLSLALVVFIAANLSVGFTFSTIAKNQLQAVQMAFFFFLPSLLLSGFMFPFRGMPDWAQWLGEVFPLTHCLRIVRGIMLKGNEVPDILPEIWPMAVFVLVVATIALRRYRQTLD